MVLPGSKNRKNRCLPERQLRKQWEKAAAWELQRHPERRRQKENPHSRGDGGKIEDTDGKSGAGRKDR